MSLKTDYFDGLTGLHQKMTDAFTAGGTYVTANLTTLSTALKDSAAQGKVSFSVTITGTGSLNSAHLRANKGDNLLLKSFFAGIRDGLSAQAIYDYECTLELDISDSVNTNVKFNFNFQAT
jgi:hypothetical protein